MKTLFLPLLLCVLGVLRAESLDDPAAQAKVESRIEEIRQWAAEPAIVAAVTAHNAALPAEHAAMTQDKWKTLSALDPFVRSFTKNEAGSLLKARKAAWVNEAFVSNAHGLKVAFLSKPSGWSHAGKPKHDVPLTGQTWQGKIEIDESTGSQQLQIAVPVLQDGKPVGSLVVGLTLSQL